MAYCSGTNLSSVYKMNMLFCYFANLFFMGVNIYCIVTCQCLIDYWINIYLVLLKSLTSEYIFMPGIPVEALPIITYKFISVLIDILL
ncbi:hypothetical protein XELAEV_18042129mg [Xenopus laevis]|uniref:Uncharacterized protein n=1 Tax=Xenopus laevis TaxID=8355 RepID=A0A974C3G3_XENLA|nr:hypothetical protein XELAEV_18042129mg [Xenopus laevis]